MAVQSEHAAPWAPHVVSRVPEWHVPPWQQPVGQEDGLQTPESPAPPEELPDELPAGPPDDDPPEELLAPNVSKQRPPGPHVLPNAAQFAQAPPRAPHAVSAEPGTHACVLSQHPVHDGPHGAASSPAAPPLPLPAPEDELPELPLLLPLPLLPPVSAPPPAPLEPEVLAAPESSTLP